MAVFGSKFSIKDVQDMYYTMNSSIDYFKKSNMKVENYYYSYFNDYSQKQNFINDKDTLEDYKNKIEGFTSYAEYLNPKKHNDPNEVVELPTDTDDPIYSVFDIDRKSFTVGELKQEYENTLISKANTQKEHAKELIPRLAAYKSMLDKRSTWDRFKGFFTGENRQLQRNYNDMKRICNTILSNGCVDTLLDTLTDKDMSDNRKIEVDMDGRKNEIIEGQNNQYINTYEKVQKKREKNQGKQAENNNIDNEKEIVNDDTMVVDGKEQKVKIDLGEKQNEMRKQLEEDTGIKSIDNNKPETKSNEAPNKKQEKSGPNQGK